MRVMIKPTKIFTYKGINYNAGDIIEIRDLAFDEEIMKEIDKKEADDVISDK